VDTSSFDKQLSNLGLHFKFFGRKEINELRRILEVGEQIMHGIHGYYQGGSAILVATNKRLLLVDKQPLFLHVDEIAYDLVRNTALSKTFLQSMLQVKTLNKNLSFRAFKDAKLKDLCEYIEEQREKFEEIASESVGSTVVNEGYLYMRHPAWRPHAPHLIRTRPTKFGV
jgi:Bacterial PH domain